MPRTVPPRPSGMLHRSYQKGVKNCGGEYFQVSTRRAGPELIWITYKCAKCGDKIVEPFD